MDLLTNIKKTNIEDEMKTSYLDYAMSVIIGRALPDVRDGLKPVHRRVLYAMHELGLTYNKAYKKSARIVGDVIGKYHPHGDSAVYDTLVRMVQDFSLRYPLVDGQGNFGSVDGDSAAAMRYTEARMAKITNELLADIEKETVDLGPNYDESLTEPLVLPTRIPNLLVNGSAGIAVGMATNIPPHNLNEIVDALILMIDNPDVTNHELMGIVKGPDFPTAGIIYGTRGIQDAYETGRGLITVRARTEIETMKGDREAIIVTELPYQVNKARLIEKIAELVRDKKITGISDLRDESDREGMRMVLELKRGEIASIILNQLYKQTAMQSTFGVNMLALVNNQPRVLNLRNTLYYFIEHRRDVVTRRTRYELRKAEERAHILEGLKIALDNLDAVIKLIRESAGPDEARQGLMESFGLSKIQAQAILDMRLQRLTGLERDKILEEFQEILKLIDYLKSVLASEELMMKIIKEELVTVKDTYGDERRTEITADEGEISIEDLIADEEMVVTISHGGYIKRNPVNIYRAQRRGGKGKIGMETKEDDFVEHLFIASTHSYLMFFTDMGRCYWLKVYQVPEAGRASRGRAIANLLQIQTDEKITTVLPVREFVEGQSILMATAQGIVKKSALMEYSNCRSKGIIAINLDEGDHLISVALTDGNQEVFLATRNGNSIRFSEKDVREIGRVGRGVIGIRLRESDQVVGMEIVTDESAILTVSEKGMGKRTDLAEYRAQSRGGMGVKTIKITPKSGPLVGMAQISDEDEIMLITSNGKVIRVKIREIRVQSRATQGVRLFDVGEGDKIIGMAKVAEQEESGNPETASDPDSGNGEGEML
ncbi:MAG: DNA gyrase subunit A [Nitrospirota bacterium]|nr:DNA gyrase subunit A [Nitrospirota bacterium]